ncbi:MAG: DUF3536 domain-containing protein, partial [Desulfuromonadales bacterium]|nr:DUF3536 domain-containing protein [Desulfuromonadales bacterium]NIR33511.1 DUF3536 domain-containing protein [Desulfuromonadales bacterium]NIS39685.1 DUF3536 domain-containing protein [Desulfuromonadales bacterium]
MHRFGRRPEGMWLPETAVDLETLDILAGHDISFTILAPHQAGRVRRIGEEKWHDVDGARIDPGKPYLCRLPSGRSINLFFYDGPVSRDVAFAGLLKRGEDFARRLLESGSDGREPQLAHIATDGETYGHHHRFGDMALAYGLNHIEEEDSARLTIYAEYLEKHPPGHEVEIIENTSWSCAHGVERWRDDCGCRIDWQSDWDQAWRGPLREALDWLRDELIVLYEQQAKPLLGEPWQARNAYLEVILDRSEEKKRAFLAEHAGRELDAAERLKALRLLEMQRQAMLMYTSCGWFFDELSGIETVQVLAYAGRALQLAQEVAGSQLEQSFLDRLEKAPSNIAGWGNGAGIYRGLIEPLRLDLLRVAAHHAIACEFEGDHEVDRVYCYTAEKRDYDHLGAGMANLGLGRTRIRSTITGNEAEFTFGVLNLGGHSVSAGVREYENVEAFEAMRREIRGAFEKADIAEVVRLMDKHFGSHSYTLWHLFRDEQRKVVNQIMDQALQEIEASFVQIYDRHYSLMRFLHQINMPVPRSLAAPVEEVLNAQLRRALEAETPELERIRAIAADLEQLPVALD